MILFKSFIDGLVQYLVRGLHRKPARVIVEIRPGRRFEHMAITLFSLAREGKTDKKGLPNPLLMAVIAQEFKDAVVFMSPPPWVQ